MAGPKKYLLKFWLPVVIYAILIFCGSSIEVSLEPDFEIYGLDKALHILEYAALGFLLARALNGSAPDVSFGKLVFISFIIGTFYGLTDELHQQFIPGRIASILDLAADSAGSFLGAFVFIQRLKKAAEFRKRY